jgi:hypothetical protein
MVIRSKYAYLKDADLLLMYHYVLCLISSMTHSLTQRSRRAQRNEFKYEQLRVLGTTKPGSIIRKRIPSEPIKGMKPWVPDNDVWDFAASALLCVLSV